MRIILLLVFNLCLASANAQVLSKELDKNEQYIKIDQEVSVSVAKADSLMIHLVQLKDSVKNHPNLRADLIKPILSFESELFELQNIIEGLKSQKSLLEHEFLFESTEKSIQNEVSLKSNFLLDQEFIRENTTAEEIETLLSEPKMDSLYFATLVAVDSIYGELLKSNNFLKQPGIDVSVADSVKLIVRGYEVKASGLVADFTKKVEMFYSTKIYIYSKLMEKLNISQIVLEDLNSDGLDLRSKMTKNKEYIFGGGLLSYYAEKQLSNHYERIVAARIDKLSVVDSLNVILAKTDVIVPRNKQIEDIDYVYADYTSLVIFTNAKYTGDGSDLPNLTVPTSGSIFSIKAIELSRAPSSATNLRKLEPIFRMKNAENKFEYYVGVYSNKAQAENDMAKIRRFGFKPIAVEFKGGGKVLPDGSIYPVDDAENLYYLQFKNMDDDIEKKLKELAPDKQITLVDGGYTLGVFDNKADMDIILKNIWVDATVEKIIK